MGLLTSWLGGILEGLVSGIVVMYIYHKTIAPDIQAVIAKFEAAKTAFEQAAQDIRKV